METVVLIKDVYNITGIGPVPVGAVKSGVLRVGMKLNIGGRIMTLKSIEHHHDQLSEAEVGTNVGISLQGGDYKLLKSFEGKEVIFSEGGEVESNFGDSIRPESRTSEPPKALHPTGLFDSLKSLFYGSK
jgi:translation elongation factor EF-Tu-like GTPase